MKINNNMIAAIILIIALLISQVTLFNKIDNLENQYANLQNLLYGVQSSLSQQNYMITTEKADYIIQGISCDKVLINNKSGILTLNMSISFDKLPADAVVSMDYRGTTNHLPSIKLDPMFSSSESVENLTYGSPQTTVLMKTSPNLYASEFNLDLGQNYEFTVLIETKDEAYREVIGLIPALEWSEPNYAVQVEMKTLGVTTPDNGRFEFNAKLEHPFYAYDEYVMPYGKVLYNFQNIEKKIAPEIASIEYRVYFKDELVDQGELAYQERVQPEISTWEVSDVSKFKADMQTDYIRELRMDFVIVDVDGNTTKSTWWADGMGH